MRQWKKMTAIIAVLCLMGTAFVVPATAEQVTEAVTESAMTDWKSADIDVPKLADETVAVLKKLPAEEIAEILAPYVPDISAEVLQEYIDMVIALLENEDFRSLMSYEEVRDLTDYAIRNLGKMAVEDPELTRKILETLEINETMITVIMKAIDHKDEIEEAVNGLEELENKEEVQRFFGMLSDDPELKNGLGELLSVMQGGAGNE